MKIFISGGTGFVGKQVCRFLLNRGDSVTATGTRAFHRIDHHADLTYIRTDTTQPGQWQDAAASADAIINLAGKSISRRWTLEYKQALRDSRILTTRRLVEAIPSGKNVIFLSTSASGFYGDREEQVLTEASPPGSDFLAQLAQDWENEALKARNKGARVALMRFGVILGKNGGAMEKMMPAFKAYLGGPQGSGMQWFPWMHLDDLTSAVGFLLENADIDGPVNFCGLKPVRNKDMAEALAQALGRPAIMPAPAFMLRLILGEFADALLASQRMIPEKLEKHGFSFNFPDIQSAMLNIVNS